MNKVETVSTIAFNDPTRKELPSRIKKNHLSELIIGNPSVNMVTRRRHVNFVKHVSYTSMIEPENAMKALLDEFWVKAMQE